MMVTRAPCPGPPGRHSSRRSAAMTTTLAAATPEPAEEDPLAALVLLQEVRSNLCGHRPAISLMA